MTKYDIFFHIVICCSIVLSLVLICHLDIVVSMWIALLVGLAKEWIDYFRGGYGTLKDLISDLIGALLGASICLLI